MTLRTPLEPLKITLNDAYAAIQRRYAIFQIGTFSLSPLTYMDRFEINAFDVECLLAWFKSDDSTHQKRLSEGTCLEMAFKKPEVIGIEKKYIFMIVDTFRTFQYRANNRS